MSRPKEIQFSRWANHHGSSLALTVLAWYQRQAFELVKALSNAGVYAHRWLADSAYDWASAMPHLSNTMTIKGTSDNRKPIPIDWPKNRRDKRTNCKILTVRQWSDYHRDAINWARLSCIVSALGNFEMYVIKIATLAFMSDLGLLAGTRNRIDGTIALKQPRPVVRNFDPLIEALTKGEWAGRLSAFRKQFGSCPPSLQNSLGELEKLRTLRNSVAHAFARDIGSASDPEAIGFVSMSRMAHDKLERSMRLISNCAKAIDTQLLSDHIGEYEFVYLYHQMYSAFPATISVGEKGRRFKQECGRAGHLISVSFAKQMADYYESV